MIMAVCAAFIALVVMASPVQAANTTDIGNIIDSVISFLAWGVGGIGGFLAIFGIVTLGIGFSGDNASEKQKGIIWACRRHYRNRFGYPYRRSWTHSYFCSYILNIGHRTKNINPICAPLGYKYSPAWCIWGYFIIWKGAEQHIKRK
jgi:hypothetical protein